MVGWLLGNVSNICSSGDDDDDNLYDLLSATKMRNLSLDDRDDIQDNFIVFRFGSLAESNGIESKVRIPL